MSAEYENMQVEKWVNLEDVLYLLLTQNTIVTQHSPSLINIRFIPIICIRFLHT